MATKARGTTKKASGRVTPRKQLAPTQVSDWKKNVRRPIELPSGKVALLNNPGMPAFLKSGLIPNSLIPIVTEALQQGQPPSGGASKKNPLADLKPDMTMVAEILIFMDNVTVECFVEPQVHPTPGQGCKHCGGVEEEREDDRLYVDEIDMDDKSFVMNWAVGGTSDLKTFRSQAARGLGAV